MVTHIPENEYGYAQGPGTVILGILLILLGLLTLSASIWTTLLSVSLIGIVLVLRGVIEAISAFFNIGSGFWVRMFGGIFSFILGILIWTNPMITAQMLTLFIAAYFITAGVIRTASSIMAREGHWGWELFSGIVSLALGFWIWSGWPLIALWFIGLLIGVEIIALGVSMTLRPFSEKGRTGRGSPAYAAR